MRSVYIISSGQLSDGMTAGSRRILNIARSLASVNLLVYICSLEDIQKAPLVTDEICPNIFVLQGNRTAKTGKNSPIRFVRLINSYMVQSAHESVVYLYPTTFVGNDFLYLLYLKFFKRRKVFCDINELRRTNAQHLYPATGAMHRLFSGIKVCYDFITYWLSEYLTPFYDGLVVISTNLEHYFSRYNGTLIRVPILCDSGLIDSAPVYPHYDGGIFRIGFAGSINARKEGFDLLFDALTLVSKVMKIRLFLYGRLESKDQIDLEKLVKRYKLREEVEYVGNLGPEELKKELALNHLLILPRSSSPQTKYGFATKLSDYIIAGVPILLTDVSDNALYFRDGYNGYLVAPGSSQIMAEKIINVARYYNNEVIGIVENAYKTARESFDYKLYSQSLRDLFFSEKTKTTIRNNIT